jgi:hypothetical protein
MPDLAGLLSKAHALPLSGESAIAYYTREHALVISQDNSGLGAGPLSTAVSLTGDRWFASVFLQRRARLSPESAFVVENPGLPHGCARLASRPGRQRRTRCFDTAPTGDLLVGICGASQTQAPRQWPRTRRARRSPVERDALAKYLHPPLRSVCHLRVPVAFDIALINCSERSLRSKPTTAPALCREPPVASSTRSAHRLARSDRPR